MCVWEGESDQEGAAIEDKFAGLGHIFTPLLPCPDVPLDNGTLLIMRVVAVVVELVFSLVK